MNTQKKILGLFLVTSMVAIGCGDDSDDAPPPPVDGGRVDTGMNMPDTGMPVDTGMPPSADCVRYCDAIAANCSGDDRMYEDNADCLGWCGGAGLPVGTEGEMAGNTIECRIYHAGVAAGDPGMHCPHAGPSGGAVCGSLTIRSEASSMFDRVDRMGMPAVSTALIGDLARKDEYNDGDPVDDGDFVPDLAAANTALHTALDDDLIAATLTPCSMTVMVAGLPQCFGQDVSPGVTVASLVVPDTLRIDPTMPAGFPNGRQLADPVMDVTLAIILLDLSAATGCGGGACSAMSLLGTNPGANDVNGGTFLTEFPYVHPAQ